jgi:NAD(P)-dependent dehydrogenase (short-subunit alcohol dehydrogenase family)
MSGAYNDAIVLVTGGSSGLGRAIAVGAAKSGAHAVIVNYASSADKAVETARMIEAEGARAVTVQGDVAQEGDCQTIAAAAREFGRIDTLFNNAGTTRTGTFADFDAADFLDTYRVNVIGAFQMTRAARSLLEAAPAGAVVNTSSVAGVTASGSSLPYTVSKGALVTLGKAMARELAPRLRVNTICPGFIDTEWFDRHGFGGGTDDMREHIREATALKQVSSPEDIAETALFLGSRAARHVTGETLIVDAGLHLTS